MTRLYPFRFPCLLWLLVLSLAHPGTGHCQEPAASASVPAMTQTPPLQLTIAQAISLALGKNPGLQQAANQVEGGVINVAQSRADFHPDLTLSMSGREHFDRTVDTNGNRDRNYETASGSLGSSVNLFNGFGDVAALRGSEWNLAGVRDSYRRDEQALVFTTVSAFLQALGDRELITVRTENLEGNRRQLEQVEALYRAGNRPISDFYQQQAQTGSAELDLLLAERNYVVSRLQLLQTIGLPPVTAVALQTPDLGYLEKTLAARPPEPPNLAALALRADLQASAKQIEAAREQITVAQAGYWPTLNLAADVNSDYTNLNRTAGFSSQFFDDNPGAAIGLIVTVPLYDRQQTRNQVAQARLNQQDARLSLLQLQLQAEAELGQAVEDFRTAQKLIGVTESQLTAARQALAAVEERYRVGAATLVELTQVRTQFADAGYQRVRARYGLIKQGAAVAYYQGDWEQMRSLLTLWENPQ